MSGGSWSFTAPTLADGTYTAQATQEDTAGNTGTTAAQRFTIDTAPPQVTLSSPALRSNNTTPSFRGTATDTTPVTVTIYAGDSTVNGGGGTDTVIQFTGAGTTSESNVENNYSA